MPLLVAASCSAGGGDGATPRGYVRMQAPALSVARPGDWTKGPDASLPLSAQAPDRSALLEAVLDVSDHGSAGTLESISSAGALLRAKDYHRTGSKDIKVKGARAAHRTDYTFTDFRGAGGPGQGADIGVLGEDDHVHTVRITWARGKLPRDVVDGIIGSIRVG
ncbi:hypothetical protein [Actinomadura parmotrematis]|uniref:Lipoprotein n=1 Tax=Actinomadura parmotrematis TaxID=2864039 RepID=A0ABS7FZT7_9ACTN|nr:hypothetical protein [Actinomadura parmotrematis]MBW8484943.1 hypothetical protein [Actinomadura parmotrematis]